MTKTHCNNNISENSGKKTYSFSDCRAEIRPSCSLQKKKNSAINQSVNQSFDLSINRSVGHLLTYTAVSRPVRFVSPRAVALFYNAYDLANYFWEVDDVEHFLCVLN